MNTYAKAGRIVLSLYFAKKEKIFSTDEFEQMGMVRVLPRKVIVAKEPIDLEKEYLAHMVQTLGREHDYKIFFYDVAQLEFPIEEIELISNEREGRLIDLMVWGYLDTPTHIVIAEKKSWQDDCENDEDYYSQEEITIYSLTEEQKQFIESSIVSYIASQFESKEDFTSNHLEFPKKD